MEESDLTKTVFDKFVKRPVFLNCQLDGVGNHFSPSLHLPNVTMTGQDIELEVVGSTTDGLQVGKIFDIGDTDVLVFSKHFQFNDDDEPKFRYLPQDPCFLQIARADIGQKVPEDVKGPLLNANDLRCMKPPYFNDESRPWFFSMGYDILDMTKVTSSSKCAMTVSVPYSDSVNVGAIETTRISSLRVWEFEHTVLSYLLHSQFGDQIDFVREILYPSNMVDLNLTECLRNCYTLAKKDLRNNLFGLLDAVYFQSPEFEDHLCQGRILKGHPLVQHAIACTPHGHLSNDIVPAIKCAGWPTPARQWIDRKRIWPSKEQVQVIVDLGFQLVAKSPYRNPNPENDFLLSFSKNEQRLAEFLPEAAKLAYRLLKHFYKCFTGHIPEEKKFKTFHLKTALFWVAEQIDPEDWGRNGNHAQDIRRIITFLERVLEERNLSHYFVPGSNLIQHFNAEILSSMSEILQFISANLLTCIYVAIEKEWKLMQQTTPEESVAQLKDPNYVNQFSWKEFIKICVVAMAKIDGYPVYDIMDFPGNIAREDFYGKYIDDVFATVEGSGGKETASAGFFITTEQIRYARQFQQLVGKWEIDPFNIIHSEVPSELYRDRELTYPPDFLKLYPMYDQAVDITVGDHVNAALFLRLKHYANVFHVICNKLREFSITVPRRFKNEDVNFIVEFLKRMQQETCCSWEDINDLLHYLLYFCHYAKLRYSHLSIGKQIVRGLKDFLQQSEYLYTIYFNPMKIFPKPLISNFLLISEIL